MVLWMRDFSDVFEKQIKGKRSGENFKCLKCIFVSFLRSQCPGCRHVHRLHMWAFWEHQHTFILMSHLIPYLLLFPWQITFTFCWSLLQILPSRYPGESVSFPLYWQYLLIDMWWCPWEAFKHTGVCRSPQLRASKPVPRYLKPGLWTMVGHSIPAQQKIPLWEIFDFPRYISCTSQSQCLLPRGPCPTTSLALMLSRSAGCCSSKLSALTCPAAQQEVCGRRAGRHPL